ncbi:hypothetical protein NS277_14125 [Novosphingobium barchaimii]|nr:hypothetical protein NS277_14125 [Novosphingobium barchaimii]
MLLTFIKFLLESVQTSGRSGNCEAAFVPPFRPTMGACKASRMGRLPFDRASATFDIRLPPGDCMSDGATQDAADA